MRKRYLRIGVVAAILVGVALLVVRLAQKVVVANESGKQIQSLVITVAGSPPVTFRNIAPGSTRTLRFFTEGEGGIAVRATLADGTVVAGEDGYVTKHVYAETKKFAIPANGRVLYEGHPADKPAR